MLEDLWAMMGVQAVGGRSAAEVARRLTERAAEAETPAFTPANAELLRRYLTIDDAPRPALDAVSQLAREAGVSLDPALEGWTHRLTALQGEGVPLDRVRLTPAFGRAFSYYDGFLFEVRSAALAAGPAGRRRRAL
jgi:ATP phosphoribosyltransferase regulatory subunit